MKKILILMAVFPALMFGGAQPADCLTCTGATNKLLIANLGSLPQDAQISPIGQATPLDLSEPFITCGDYSFNFAQAATVSYSIAPKGHAVVHSETYWNGDAGHGRISCLSRAGGSDSCVINSIVYYVYNVQAVQ